MFISLYDHKVALHFSYNELGKKTVLTFWYRSFTFKF